MAVSVMITTRNRCDCLQETLSKLSELTPPPDEILITADGCTDQTVAMVEKEFPYCRLIINHEGRGSVASRDTMIRQASHDIIISLDDDSYPVTKDCVIKLLDIFNAHPEASVITFPELRDNGSYDLSDRTPNDLGRYVSFYANAVAAMRKSFYLELPGFRSEFYHCYEELDYALQSYGIGAAVWFEPSILFRHHYTPKNRNECKTHFINARNELWSVWLRCPWPWLVPVSIYRILRQMLFAANNGFYWLIKEPHWWYSAMCGLQHCIKGRNPIPWNAYYRWMTLTKNPIYTQQDFHKKFPR